MIDLNLVRIQIIEKNTGENTLRSRPKVSQFAVFQQQTDYGACKKHKHYHGHSLSSYWGDFVLFGAKSVRSNWWVFSMTFDLWHVNDGDISYPESPTPSTKFLCCTNHVFWLSAKNARLFINYTMASWWRLFLITTRINQDFIFTLRFHQTKRSPVPRWRTIFNPAGGGGASARVSAEDNREWVKL